MPTFDVAIPHMEPGDEVPFQFLTTSDPTNWPLGGPTYGGLPTEATLASGPGTYVFSVVASLDVDWVGVVTPNGTWHAQILVNGIAFPALGCNIGFDPHPDHTAEGLIGRELPVPDHCDPPFEAAPCDAAGVGLLFIPYDFTPGPFTVSGIARNDSDQPVSIFVAGGSIQIGSGCGGTYPVILPEPTSVLTTTASLSGGLIYDSAALSFSGGYGTPGGSITFRLYGPSDPTYSTPLDEQVVAVSGAGTYSTPVGFDPSATGFGVYTWIATYSGDNFYALSAFTDSEDADEKIDLSMYPGLSMFQASDASQIFFVRT